MNKHLIIRRTHRYLGLVIGIQFLGWTISGLYFSWNDIDNVHGDHMRKDPHFISAASSFVSPDKPIQALKATTTVDSIHSVQLISVSGKPVYQILYFSGHAGEVHHSVRYKLANAVTGDLREPLSKDEAIEVAKDNVVSTAKVIDVKLIESTDGHNEYRERPLPAYAISFEDPDCTVYISTERGTFQTIRHDQWRGFDFLWMFHTMDYESRDDINNWLLRIFSIFGLLTVLSGFTLYFVSSRTLKKLTT
jgi:hypothetical protein